MGITEGISLVLLLGIAVGLAGVSAQLKALEVRRPPDPAPDFPYYAAAPHELSRIIDVAEREAGIEFTRGGRQMLVIPVIETIELDGRVDWAEVRGSINRVAQTIAEEQGGVFGVGRAATSVSVIRAFFRRFCNIPPFCSR